MLPTPVPAPCCQRLASLDLAARLLASLLLAGCATAPAPAPAEPPALAVPAPADVAAPDADAHQAAFAAWVSDFAISARAAGITDDTLRGALAGVRHLPRVVALDRAQPEFNRPIWDYLDRSVSPRRVASGQARLAQLRSLIDAAAARDGVPAEVLVAIWGMESDYGANTGDLPTIDALATLGFDGRRADWARTQLIAALRILQQGDIDRAQMVGSWAGAMGQTQFLPTSYLAHAVDADGDGRRDIWGSLPDVFASTARLLARAGWRPGEPWGTELRLPPGFDAGRADASVRQTAGQWAAEGVQAIDGAPLPALDDAAVLLPAGVRGPAFLVGANFRVLLRYNNATAYALAVGLLSHALAGGPGVQVAWPRDQPTLSRSQVQALQTALNAGGFDSGTPDGLLGPATRAAVRRFQRSIGEAADGHPTPGQLQRLGLPG